MMTVLMLLNRNTIARASQTTRSSQLKMSLSSDLNDLRTLIELAMKRDQYPLRRRWARLERQFREGIVVRPRVRQHKSAQELPPGVLSGLAAEPAVLKSTELDREFCGLKKDIERSVELLSLRKSQFPVPQLDQSLPLFEQSNEIKQALLDHQVIVVSGETGSGKSTQLPLICLQAGFGVSGFIGHTQPRRIAARGVAARVASLLHCRLGEQVGCKIRFSDQTNETTYVKLMTDGILLAETQTDRFLDQYEVLIVDEAHERSLNIDFLLGYLRRLIVKRTELRIIITSATIDTEKFANHFTLDPDNPVPVFRIAGRTYPVEICYRPLEWTESNSAEHARYSSNAAIDGQSMSELSAERDMEDAVVDTVIELSRKDPGDVLVFLPTEHDIRVVAKKLRGLQVAGGKIASANILPLYARLTNEQQSQVFQAGAKQRIVLATNVAESSITVPGIRYVIDTGTARISRYAPRSKVQRLPIEPISQASARQRAGRCGRVGPGICVRLYSETDFVARPEFTTPEIRRTNLASVILQVDALKLGAIEEFPFVDPPRPESIRDGYKTLLELGAVDEAFRLTPLGRRLSKIPADPRIARMLFAASDSGCLAEVLVIAAALEGQDARMRPAERQKAADIAHARFVHESSDFLSWLKLWDFLHELRGKLSHSKFKKACHENFISASHFQQWADIHRQLREMAKSAGLHYNSKDYRLPENYRAIHEAIATGLLSGVAMLSDRFEYVGAGGVKFSIWPGSGLFAAKPKWIVAAEVVETSKRFGRTVAKIEPEWIEPLSQHICKRAFVDPHWSSRQETTMAYENVSLFGLPIVVRRRVAYAKHDPELSRRIFIEHGLVQGELKRPPRFLNLNQTLCQEAETWGAKTRQRHCIFDEWTVRKFYDDRLPPTVVDTRSLIEHLKRDDQLEASLTMSLTDLVSDEATANIAVDFPDQVRVGEMDLPVSYRFAPGEFDDGATVEVPVEALSQLNEQAVGWLIPGHRIAYIEALIRCLPKSIRRSLVPAPETARVVAERLEVGTDSFLAAVARELGKIARVQISPSSFDLAKIDDYLKVNFRLVDQANRIVSQSRDIGELLRELPQGQNSREVEATDNHWMQDRLTTWCFGNVPDSILVKRNFTDVPVFPAIVDQGDAVGLRLFDNVYFARREMQKGVARLFFLRNAKLVRSHINWLPELDQLSVTACLLFSDSKSFRQNLEDLLVRIACIEDRKVPASQQEFDRICQDSNVLLGGAAQQLADWLPKTLRKYQAVRLEMDKLNSRTADTRNDIASQLAGLFPPEFMRTTPWRWLQHFPRFLAAASFRIERVMSGHQARDLALSSEIKALWEQYQQVAGAVPDFSRHSEHIERVRWLFEELRVSMFAQPIGTSEKVSPKRIEKLIDEIRQAL
ncbi:MAG TPA: ATP-dependent RNA helicase HrpA [Pirellulaceae bacterium]|nr:ATP-dependent RNA helicase HrpA [Pirellulaceae bacterium]HMO93419.1 ATP-dependent RNA helicase HrpA [Pirellulaceae bacterium]HMP70457.1 ATP-dependent RNA helicase HrpA [Pirellulaceae bacterium]